MDERLKISRHIIERIENIIYHIDMNRRTHENDSRMLDEVYRSLLNTVYDHEKLMSLDRFGLENAIKHKEEDK